MTEDLARLAQEREWEAKREAARIAPRANESRARRELYDYVNKVLLRQDVAA